MNLEQLQAINDATDRARAARRAGAGPTLGEKLPYYGYVAVDVFDCPPFLLFTNNDSPGVACILETGMFEPCSTSIWCAMARVATGIVDMGANVGIYSLCAAKLRPELSVHAFEPNPYAYARLRMHKFANELTNLQEHPFAVGEKDALLKLRWVVKPGGNIASGAGLGKLSEKHATQETVVQMVALDGKGLAATLGTRPLVKIDVEGAEVSVLNGAKELLALRPDIIIETLYDTTCEGINDLLLPLGYSVYGISEKNRILERREGLRMPAQSDLSSLNHLVTTRSAEELAGILPKDIRIVAAS